MVQAVFLEDRSRQLETSWDSGMRLTRLSVRSEGSRGRPRLGSETHTDPSQGAQGDCATAAGLRGAEQRGDFKNYTNQQKLWNNRKHPPPHLPCRQEASGQFLE